MTRVLYISYDGVMEPLGQSQVLQYLKRLADCHEITLLSYEKPADWADKARRNKFIKDIRATGIRWWPLCYHKSPSTLATAYDLVIGLFLSVCLLVRHRIEIVHVRSYVPAVLGLVLKRLFGRRFVFDMRGFWADERIDGGIWQPDSRLFRVAKRFERQFLSHADVVISLTRSGVEIMRSFPYLQAASPRFEVIPTCTNLDGFYPMRHISGARKADSSRFTLGYVGSAGTWYLFDEALECFRVLLSIRPDACLLILNRYEHEYIQERLRVAGIPENRVEIKAVMYPDMARAMSGMDAGIFFIKPVFSKQASSPTKMGEFLACGIPCLANAGVGDVEHVLDGSGAGVVVRSFSPDELEAALGQLLVMASDPATKARCVSVARQYFSLDNGVQSCSRIYESLAGSSRSDG